MQIGTSVSHTRMDDGFFGDGIVVEGVLAGSFGVALAAADSEGFGVGSSVS